MPKETNDLIEFVQDLVKKHLAGKGGSTFSPLFEGKIRDEVLNPLFRRINYAINTAHIKPQDIDLGHIVKEAIGKINISEDVVRSVNAAFSNKFNSIATSINSIDSSAFKDTILQDITAKFDKSIKDISVLKADINLAEMTPFKSDEASSQKYKNIVSKVITQLEGSLDKLQIESAGISQDTIFKALFNDTSANSEKVNRQYRDLASNTLKRLSAYVDVLNINSTSSISQQSILDILFSNADISAGLFVRSSFNALRSNVLKKLGSAINSEAFDFKVGDRPLDQTDLLNMLFSSNAPEYSGLLSLSNSQRAFNVLRSDVLARLSAAAPQKFEISNDPITPSKLLNILFSGSTPEYSSFFGIGGSAAAFNRLRTDVLKKLEASTDNIKIDASKTLSQRDIIDVLFNQTPELGLLSRFTLWDVRTNILRKIEKSFKVEDESISKKDILEILFNSATSKPFDLSALSKKITELVSSTTAQDITTPGREIATKEGDEIFTRSTFNISEESIIDLVDRFRQTLGDADLLTNKRQTELNKELINILTKISDNRDISSGESLGAKLGDFVKTLLELKIVSKIPGLRSIFGGVTAAASTVEGVAGASAAGAEVAGTAASTIRGASRLSKLLKIGGIGLTSIAAPLSLYSGYKESEEADELQKQGFESAAKWKRAQSWLDGISGTTGLAGVGATATGIAAPAAVPLFITSGVTGLLSMGAGMMADRNKSSAIKDLADLPAQNPLTSSKLNNMAEIQEGSNNFSTLIDFLTPSFSTLHTSINRIDSHLTNIHSALISGKTNSRDIAPIPMTPATKSINTPPTAVTRTDIMDFRRAVKEGVL